MEISGLLIVFFLEVFFVHGVTVLFHAQVELAADVAYKIRIARIHHLNSYTMIIVCFLGRALFL